jgi:hypothetical protein
LSQLRGRTPSLNVRGLTHLFTGRDLDGNTVGTAYTGGLCSKTYGAGLTQVSGSVGIDSLIAAHEIGHNFGAEHDGSGVCASTPVNQYIMSPQVTASATSFSQCSLDAIRPVMQSASCLMPMSAPDLAVDADLGTRTVALNTPFEWPITVTNQGGSTAINAKIVVLVPPVITVDDAGVLGGSCTSGAGVTSCLLGDIAAAGSRVIRLTLRSDLVVEIDGRCLQLDAELRSVDAIDVVQTDENGIECLLIVGIACAQQGIADHRKFQSQRCTRSAPDDRRVLQLLDQRGIGRLRR